MTTTKEAAIKWFKSTNQKWNGLTDKKIESKWMQEVVLPWWNNCDYADKMALAKTWLSTLPESFTDEIISSIYLKEHEGKEDSKPIMVSWISSGGSTGFNDYHLTNGITLTCKHEQLEFKLKELNGQQPEVSLPVSEKEIIICENCKEYHIAPMSACVYCGGKSFEKTHPSNLAHVKNWTAGHFINQYPASTEETVEEAANIFAIDKWKDYCDIEGVTEQEKLDMKTDQMIGQSGSEYDFKQGVEWQNKKTAALLHEQNGIIYDLLHALSNAMQYVPFDCGTKKDCGSAITKAENYLNQNK